MSLLNGDSFITSKQIMNRIEQLKESITSDCGKSEDDFSTFDEWVDFVNEHTDGSEIYELEQLVDAQTLIESNNSDFGNGSVQLIHDDEFVNHIQELCYDEGFLPNDLSNMIHIDWQATADEFKPEYISVSLGGHDYWIKCS